jgi:hypothetical protein
VLKKKHLLPMILQTTFALASEPEDADADDEDEPVYKWGTVALEELAKNLPSKVLVLAMMPYSNSEKHSGFYMLDLLGH